VSLAIASTTGWAALPAAAQETAVGLRPSAPGETARSVSGVVESVGLAGVVVRSGEGPSARRVVIALDDVAVLPAAGLNAPVDLSPIATDLWRARQRVERGDCQAAEPLLDVLAPIVLPAGGPTGAKLAEGLLTCRLARDARTTALFAWLDWLRIVRAGPGLSAAPAGSLVAPPAVSALTWESGQLVRQIGRPPFDSSTGLVPALPPIWVPGVATEALAASTHWQRLLDAVQAGSPQDPLLELCELYRAAAEADCGRPATLPARSAASPAISLVRDVVSGRIGDDQTRAAARDALSARIDSADTPPWIEAWCRAGLGRSLIVEPDADLRRRGVLMLLHLPSRFARTEQHLAAIALAEATITLARDGDAQSAAALRAELARAFPNHPAVRWVAEHEGSGSAPGASSMILPAALAALSLTAMPYAQPVDGDVDAMMAVGPDDALEAYLMRLGLSKLLAEHLELRLASVPRERRAPIADRLAKLYVTLLEASTDTQERGRWEAKADALLKEVPEAEGFELRISLSRALYVRAEDICERSRLRLASSEEAAEAQRVLRQLEPQLREIAAKVHRRVDALERIEKQGDATDEVNRQLTDARRVRSLAFYYSGWCSYYLAFMTRTEPPAIEAMKSFGWLLNSPSGRLATLDRIPRGLLRYEHVARAAMGCALAAAARNNDVEAMSWLEAVEESDELPDAVKSQLLLRKIGILGPAKRWADLERIIRIARNSDRSGAGLNVRPLTTNEARLLAVVTLEADRRVAASSIELLAKLALGDLIGRGEVAHVLDLVDKFGTAPIGEAGFIVHYVRAVKAYDQAREAHKLSGGDLEEPATADNVLNLYRAASGLLTATLSQPDADQFKPERVRAAMFAARAAFYAGDFVPAADGFQRAWEIATAINRASTEAEDALWLAVVSLDRAAGRPAPSADVVRRRTEAGAVFLQTYPDSPRAARLLLMRAASGDVSDDEAMRVLEGVPKDSPLYDASRRQIARILYNRFRAASGPERDFAAMKFITVGEELLAMDRRAATQISGKDTDAANRAILRARQLLDALLGVSSPDADRAQSTLELIRTLASITGVSVDEHEAELTYRELQIALARGQEDPAIAAAKKLSDMPAAQREFAPAADRLLYRRAATQFRDAKTEQVRSETAKTVVLYGARLIDRMSGDSTSSTSTALIGVQSVVADASFVIWRDSGGTEAGGGDEAMRALSLRMDRLILKASPNTAESLRRLAVTAEASGDHRSSLESWSVLLSAALSGSDSWFEARYHALRLIARLEPARARELLDQHRALFPSFGPAPWGEKILELDRGVTADAPAQPQGAR